MVLFRILGEVRLNLRGRQVDLGARKNRGLLGILLLSANLAVPVDKIAERLWDLPGESGPHGVRTQGREPPPNPTKTLQTYISRLRAILDKAQAPVALHTKHGRYRLQVESELVDYHQFKRLVDEARHAARLGEHARAIPLFDAAIELWQGDPLIDLDSSWARTTASALTTQTLVPAYHGLLDAHLALGHTDHVLTTVRQLLDEFDTDESLAGLLLRALAEVEGPDSVARAYQDIARRLRHDEGVEPGLRLRQLYERLIDETSATGGLRIEVADRTPPPFQLPRDIPNFVGRADVLGKLDDTLLTDRAAVVALDGAPGVGKTALATHWATMRSGHFPDGVLHADLNGYGPDAPAPPTAVLTSCLEAFGVPVRHMPKDTEGRVSLLRQTLTGRRVLVVLDNAYDSQHVRPLLRATSPCPVLITSRQKLSLLTYRDGARSITIETLMPPDSVELLERRIGSARAGRNMTALHDLVALCGGLPLALQIVGEHVGGRTETPLPDLVNHLRQQRRLLHAGGNGDSDSLTLRAVFDWSCDALDPGVDRLFRLLGLLPAAQVSTSAAAAIADLPIADVENAFETLVGAHLVGQRAADRYQYHDLVHLYAAERAEARETPEARAAAVLRMLDWYLASAIAAIQLVAPHQKPVPPLPRRTAVRPRTFRDEQDAMRWCQEERPQILAVAHTASAAGLNDHLWRLIGTFAEILNRYGNPREAADVHLESLRAARLAGARDGEAGILNNIGVVEFYLGEYERAFHYFKQALDIFREIDDEPGEAISLHNMANTHLERNRFRTAIELQNESLDISLRINDQDGQARVYHRLGDAYRRMERPDQAADYYQQALSLRTQGNDLRGQAETLAKMGELYIDMNDPTRAVEYCDKALEINRRTVDERKSAEALRTRAAAYYRLGQHDRAIASATDALLLCRTLSDRRGQARALDIRAQAQYAYGETAAARKDWGAALDLFEELGDPRAAYLRERLGLDNRTERMAPPRRRNRLGPRS